MSLYMFRVQATAEAVKGVMAEGVAARAANAKQVVESLGGKMVGDGYYVVEGSGATAVLLVEFGETESAAALSLAVSASGVGTINYERLLTPEEAQVVVNRIPSYRPPGS